LYAHKIKLGTWERRLRLHVPETATKRNYLFIVCAILVLDFFFFDFVCLVSVRIPVGFAWLFLLNFNRMENRGLTSYYSNIIIVCALTPI